MNEKTLKKLEILASAAKYDASCASSGGKRKGPRGGVGNVTGMGICHSFTEDGRCVSLLQILFTNHCIFDCAYCVSRRSSDVARAAFTVEEVVELTLGFYRRNYIEGLFLSSGIFKDADTTTERLVRVARELRETHRFGGYIHLKVIPGASDALLEEAGRYADRLSVNLEIASEPNLKKVAPEKDHASAFKPMGFLRDRIAESREERRTSASKASGRRTSAHPKPFAAGGQSTQLVVGATAEDDQTVLGLSSRLYQEEGLKRVYYSGYVPINPRLPAESRAPLVRENRLYQADWLLRYYGYAVGEIVDDEHPNLDLHLDPKAAYALRHPYLFPVDPNEAPYEVLLRVPGVGVKSARRIVAARPHGRLRWSDLQKIGVVLKRARYFITVEGHRPRLLDRDPAQVRGRLLAPRHRPEQLSLF